MNFNVSDYLNCAVENEFRNKFLKECSEKDLVSIKLLQSCGADIVNLDRPTFYINSKLYILNEKAQKRYHDEEMRFVEQIAERLLQIGMGGLK